MKNHLAAAAAILLLATTAACSKDSPEHVVKPDGSSSHTFGPITISADAQTVKRKTVLTTTAPQANNQDAPLAKTSRASALKFDVTLKGTQPLKPLHLRVNLKDLLPKDFNPQHVLLYTPAQDGGFQLAPSTVEGTVLAADLAHLSPKWLVFPDFGAMAATIADNLFPEGIYKQRPSNCKKQIGDVRLGMPKNWSDGRTSGVHPCVQIADGRLQLKVVNNSYTIWSVAASSGARIQPKVDEIDAEMVKLIARKVFPDRKTQAYLGRQGHLVIDVPQASLPARVELKASPGPFLAEAAWVSLNYLVGLSNGASAVQATMGRLLDTASAINCLQNAIEIPKAGNLATLVSDYAEVFGSVCGETIAKAIGIYSVNPGEWNKFWKRATAIVDGVQNGLEVALSGLEGASRQITGTVVVTLYKPSPCLSEAQLKANYGVADNEHRVTRIICEQGWVYGVIEEYYEGWRQSGTALLEWSNGDWIDYGGIASEFFGGECNAPPKIRRLLKHC